MDDMEKKKKKNTNRESGGGNGFLSGINLNCGTSSRSLSIPNMIGTDRIVGGDKILDDESWPWLASMDGKGFNDLFCFLICFQIIQNCFPDF